MLLPEARIEIVDSLSTMIELGLLVLATARFALSGVSLTECKQFAEQARLRTGLAFAVDTLEFLYLGGRIGGADRLLGTMLNIKPILTIADGSVAPLEPVRTRRKSFNHLVEIIPEAVDSKSKPIIAIAHANAPDDARNLLGMTSARLNPTETMLTELSPVVGMHVGPGTVVLGYYFED